ncbi:uncharacterized protein METZ01_LOCUS345675, partial [marine metagenome]
VRSILEFNLQPTNSRSNARKPLRAV